MEDSGKSQKVIFRNDPPLPNHLADCQTGYLPNTNLYGVRKVRIFLYRLEIKMFCSVGFVNLIFPKINLYRFVSLLSRTRKHNSSSSSSSFFLSFFRLG
jgi:hypothetical protein